MLVLVIVVGALILLFRERGPRDLDSRTAAETRKTEAGRSAILFIGSSTIDRFPLADAFPLALCVNLGQGNEDAVRLRERLKTALPSVPPAGIVLYAGSADLRFDPGLSAVAIRERVAPILADLRSKYGNRPIAMLQVLAAREQTPDERAALAAVNAQLASLAGDHRCAFVKTNRAPLVDRRGDLVESMSTDRHHLNADGYRVLARWIIEDGGEVGRLLR